MSGTRNSTGGEPDQPPHVVRTILLVEDDEMVRALISEVLQAKGYRMIEASDGREAMDASERYSGRIHLLVTDLLMPRMNGAELAERIAATRSGIKILIMSGYSDRDLIESRITGGEAEFLLKPFRLDTLINKVGQILDGNESLQ